MNIKEHLLVCLVEECAEVQQAVAKSLRFGLDDGYPGTDRTNLGDLEAEILDLISIIEMCHEYGILPQFTAPNEKMQAKKDKVRKFMEISKANGVLS